MNSNTNFFLFTKTKITIDKMFYLKIDYNSNYLVSCLRHDHVYVDNEALFRQ